MSGFLRRQFNGDELDPSAIMEETYEKLFPKIGRDFVYKEDFYRVIHEILALADPTGFIGINLTDDFEARRRALIYKSFLDQGKDGSKVYKDLVDLEEA